MRGLLSRLATLMATLTLIVTAAIAAPVIASAAEQSMTTVTVGEVNLDGPRIENMAVRIANDSPTRMRSVQVTLEGPVGWLTAPSMHRLSVITAGGSAEVVFQVQVPERRGSGVRVFTAHVSYRGGDGVGSATGERTELVSPPLPNLAAAYNNVGITDASTYTQGNLDNEGNSFDAAALADAGLVPGQSVQALGASFTWPSAAPGTANNVAANSQAITLNGRGAALAFLGTGTSTNAAGTVVIHYSDGSQSTAGLSFPNWSFQDAGSATVVAAANGRNLPTGYGNAGIDYRVFAVSVPVDSSKDVAYLELPSNPSIHVFDVAFVP